MVFLSHSSKDKEFVKELDRRLTRDGVSCFFDIKSIGWGDNWVRALERAIDECEYIVFVLSPDFCNSEWAEVEHTSAIADDPSGLKHKVRPVMLVECRHLPTFPRFLRQIQIIDVSTNQLFEENYKRICLELGGLPQEDVSAMPRNKLPPVQPLPERNRMPYASLGDNFIGRVDAIWELHDSLYRDSITVLQGIGVVAGAGGLGKTQLAIEYAHRFGAAYSGGVYWVQADLGVVALITQISTAAGIEIDTKVEESEQTVQLWRELNKRNKPCLVILDNFPENVALRAYLPTTGRVHTIITTRRQDLSQSTVRLPILPLADSVRLLNSGERQLGESAVSLAERLGGLPLALELCKSYLNYRKDLTVSALIEEMEAEGEMDVLKEFASEYHDQLPSRHELDVTQTFQLSWNIAPESAKQVLRVLGELAPAPVPRAVLREILEWPAHSGLRDELSRAVSELARLSLAELDSHDDPSLHRLIAAFIRHRNSADDASFLARCLEVIQAQMQKAVENPDADTIRELERLLPHAEFLAGTGRLSPEQLGDLLNQIGAHYRNMGRFTAARHALERALASDKNSFAPGHPNIARTQSNLGLVLSDLGQLEEARDLLRQALASNEKSFPPGHLMIATAQSILALALRDLGQLEEARDLLRQALASDEKSFAPGHANIATRQSNLALALKDLGQLEEARDLLRHALASNEKSFGPYHPSVATSQSNLAMVLHNLGQLEEARDLLRQALASAEKSFEPGHPTIATRQSNLALALKHLGELDEARDLARRAYSTFLERFGPDHPKTKVVKHNLDSLPDAE